METKANHLLIGGFMLILVAGTFGFFIWLAKIDITRELAYYTIYFTDSVAGLGVGGDVRFHGIKVGSVAEIAIDRQDPSRVKVIVEIAGDTPIRSDSYAVLQLQGITGVSFVQISGGSPDAPLLEAKRRGEPTVIPSRPSEITKLFESAPQVLARAIVLLDRVTDLFNPENQKHISDALADLATITNTFARNGPQIEHIIVAADASARDVTEAVKSMRDLSLRLLQLSKDVEETLSVTRGTLTGINDVVSNDGKALLDDTRKTAQAMTKTADELQGILAENRQGISTFSNEGLSQLTRFIAEARQLVAAMSRVTERIGDDPARLLFGDKVPERKAK